MVVDREFWGPVVEGDDAREKQGLPGKEIKDFWIKAVEKYESKSPYKDILSRGF